MLSNNVLYILDYVISLRDFSPRPRVAAMDLPPFHTLGIMVQIMNALRGYTTVALYPPITKRPDLLPTMATPETLLDHAQRTKSNSLVTIPSILQVWSEEPKSVEFLKSLEFAVSGRSKFECFCFHVFLSIGVWRRSNSSENW